MLIDYVNALMRELGISAGEAIGLLDGKSNGHGAYATKPARIRAGLVANAGKQSWQE